MKELRVPGTSSVIDKNAYSLQCITCGKVKAIKAFGWTPEHRRSICICCQAKTAKQSLRARILDAYGSVCACCGEKANEFLTIDHIGNLGHRENSRHRARVQVWQNIVRENFPKDKYRILCYNCNCSIGIHGYCPHRPNDKCKPAQQLSRERKTRIAEIKQAHERLLAAKSRKETEE